MSTSKTARASAVKEPSSQKQATPDAELIRQLRLDREGKLYPSVQGTDALLRAYDALLSKEAAAAVEAQ